ncbi:ABC transporter permease subunit [Solwaraspora sp. WMMD1047]|uniref:ABC transporter permease subunit n=1 Tax=Solwaraspora sp. WMMD1047 TaxID=3016102 RepID=UPI0024171E57|nr:ABC transporter permease subunit [Solwaraspora sp. WMMD1047]MDG4828575.1 ABC transporter permease subunit [Solwaraspora sp. WMMD1047]
MPRSDTAAPPTGVIHDIGYQRYEGTRLGRRHIVGALYLHGLRTAFGLGRSAKAKIFPWLIVGTVGAVAAVLVAIRTQTGEVVLSYPEFPEVLTLLIIFFCAIVAPELASRDLHSGVLPLYFARPLRRSDYALAKLAALLTATFLMLAGPLTVMFAGAAFSLPDVSAVWTEFGDFLPGVAHAAIHAVVFGSIALLIASVVKRRAVAAAAIVGAFLVTTPVVGVLAVMPSRTANELSGLASPATLVGGIGDWLFGSDGEFGVGDFGPLYGLVAVGFVAACVLLLLARYRKVAAA